jgi:type IV pilus assembly protein PilM
MLESMLPHRTRQRGSFIGLDIGSHAIRAAEVKVDGHGATLQHYAYVDLPPGAVADGEVVDASAVGSALRRLWAEGKFSQKKVVVGVSSQRVIVRQADVPAMSEEDLRSALKFEAQDLIPIPAEEALLDFSIIDGQLPSRDPSDSPKMRILLAAAHHDMVNGHLGALKSAGLKPLGVDPVALALLRAIPPPSGLGDAGTTVPLVEAIIAVGAPLTTVAIREDGMTRFVRVLNIGGDELGDGETAAAKAATNGSQQQAGAGAGVTLTIAPRMAGASRVHALVDDIRGSLDFYLAQADTDRVDRIVVTGEAALTEGLLPRLQEALGRTVEIADPLATVAIGKTGLSPEQLRDAVPYLVAPIGLALWGAVAGRPISLLPDEVLQAGRQKRQVLLIAFAVSAFAALLGLAWGARTVQVTNAKHQASDAQARSSALSRQVVAMSDVTKVDTAVKASQQVQAAALARDVDWIRLIEQVTAVMPGDVHLTTVTVSRSATGTAGATASDGTITFGAFANGGPPSVANWLRALATIPGLSGVSVASIAQTVATAGVPGGSTFASSATVTTAAESQRSIKAGAAK